jgi:hypothetical protein
MAVDGRINVRHEDVFPVPVLVLGVEPAEDFDKIKAARAAGQVDGKGRVLADVQVRDKESGLRLWQVSILDPSAKQGQREIKVKVAAEVQPVPPNGLMQLCEFEGLQVIPYLDSNRTKPRVAIAYRAAGFRGKQRQSAAA